MNGSRAGGRGTARGALALLVGAIALVVPAGPEEVLGQASARSAVSCSETGDSCDALLLRRNRVVVQSTYVERVTGRVRLCVRPPGRARICRRVPFRPTRGGASVARITFPARTGVWTRTIFPGEVLRLRVPAR